MEMQQVRYFLAVARTLNFTRAAEQCNVTQPALTRAIKQLEDELGGELIRREGRLSHLSDLGTRMLPLLTQCYESALGAKALAAKVKAGEVASLAIGMIQSLDIRLLLPALGELQRVFKDLQLTVRRGSGASLAEWLKSGEIELGFGSSLGEAWDRLDSWPMFTEPFALVVANDHALASVNDAELQGEMLRNSRLLVHTMQGNDELTQERLDPAGIRLADAHWVDCNLDLTTMVRAKLGVAILPKSAFRSGDLRHLDCPGLDLERTVTAYSIGGRPRSREASALLGLVRSADWDAQLAA